jgi:energy-coupling factor transport system permease protein
MTNAIVLGQFVPGDSPVHRLDPRTKILAMIAYIVLVFLVRAMPVFAVPLLFVLGALLASGVPARYALSSLRPMRWLIAFMFLINLFFTQGERVLFSWWIVRVTAEGVRQAVFISLRLILLVAGTSLLTLTTSPIALTDGLERLLKPLKRIRFPAHELAMMMTIALRFIPTLLEETERIRKAQMARGADFETGGLLARARAMVPLLVPLFVSAFRRADELAMAMESRCYHGGEGRTRMHELHYARRDLLAALLIALLLAAVPVIQLWI